jgi:hypothetical protein
MTLLEKLNKIYEEIDHIEKRGENKMQHYRYIRSADVTHALRKAFINHKIYAEINFDNIAVPYTVAREKAPNAPFTANLVRCTIVFHDLESKDTVTSSGLGTGCDNSDKAVYKAETGALKYALKNAFMIPDEADPEADESVDEGSNRASQPYGDEPAGYYEPAYEPPQPVAPRVVAPAPPPTAPPAAEIPEKLPVKTAKPAVSAAKPETGVDLADVTMPTEEEMNDFRKKFKNLGDELTTNGKLKSSSTPKLPVGIKLRVFLLFITGADVATNITKAQWVDFFARAAKMAGPVDDQGRYTNIPGLVEMGKLVNKINGIDEKQK